MHDQDERTARSNELILNPGEYAFLQDAAKGSVQTHCGPLSVAQTGQLRPIKFIDGSFIETNLSGAVVQFATACRGKYIILENPTEEDQGLKHPAVGNISSAVPELKHGEKIVVPGPCKFALWPEQIATCVDGHHLRSDQFLVVQVYDANAAVVNWNQTIVTTDDESDDAVVSKSAADLDLTLGQLFVIRDVSFYIPPTGIEVVPDEEGNYVRDALTLEMSEYAILIDQNGNKRYEQGPQIVFPTPTEEFFADSDGNVKFKPIELTTTQGLHIKVNCDYKDYEWPEGYATDGVLRTAPRAFNEGDEIFITGATHPIYYPREEHSIIRYGDNLVHFATAVSAGQARYVMNKETGVIDTRVGPDMILLDPTCEVFVKRVLSDAESHLMYPGNQDSLTYNQELRSFQATTGQDSRESISKSLTADFAKYGPSEVRSLHAMSVAAPAAFPDQIHRRTSYTKPHSVTLDDRFSGAPTLKIWTGFAVLLVKADGTRRIEVGPQVVTLDFDETVSPLHLSTGKPKTTDNLLTTGYLEVRNNKVGDIVEVETLDGVTVRLKLSYRVSFAGNHDKWFDIDNYVKFLCDHIRSRLKGEARLHNIREFYNNTVAIVRDNILGAKIEDTPRSGLIFEENGMEVTDVELLLVKIADSQIASLLVTQQQAVVTNQIEIDRAKQTLQVTEATQDVARRTLLIEDDTRQTHHALLLKRLEDEHTLAELRDFVTLEHAKMDAILAGEHEKAEDIHHKSDLERRDSDAALDMRVAESETAHIVSRFEAANGDLAAAIRHLGDESVLEKVAEAMGPMRLIGGGSITDALAGLIGSPGNRNDLFDRLTTLVDAKTNGSN